MSKKSRQFTLKQKGINKEKCKELKEILIKEPKGFAYINSRLKHRKFLLKKRYCNLAWDKETYYNYDDLVKNFEGKTTPSGKLITHYMIEMYYNCKYEATKRQIRKFDRDFDGYYFPKYY